MCVMRRFKLVFIKGMRTGLRRQKLWSFLASRRRRRSFSIRKTFSDVKEKETKISLSLSHTSRNDTKHFALFAVGKRTVGHLKEKSFFFLFFFFLFVSFYFLFFLLLLFTLYCRIVFRERKPTFSVRLKFCAIILLISKWEREREREKESFKPQQPN